MEKERKFKTIGIVAVLVAIIGLSIAFAALSQTLSINGTAKQESSNWQVVWEKISGEDFVTTGTAEVQDNYPTLTENDTNLNLGIITLKKPGDKVTYRVNMANKGTIDAKVTGVTGVSLDNTYVSYSVKYLDNNIDITAANGRLLAANQRKMVLIEVKFKESVTTEEFNAIPEEGITVNLNGVQIQYSQNDGESEIADLPDSDAVMLGINAVEENDDIDITSRYGKSSSEFDFSKVKSITITNTNEAVSNAEGSWDASGGNNTVTASYITDSDGKYKLYIGGDGGVYAPVDSSLLFGMFENLASVDLSYLNTSRVTNMTMMFALFHGSALDLSTFNTSNVTDMTTMFNSSSVQTINMSGWDTSNVTNMTGMFAECTSLTSIDLSKFKTSNVTNMMGMFLECTSLTHIYGVNGYDTLPNGGSFIDTSNVTNMLSMFDKCTSLVNLDLSHFDTSSVTDMSTMFFMIEEGAVENSLKNLNLSSFTVSPSTNVTNMFTGLSVLETLNISSMSLSAIQNKSELLFSLVPDNCLIIVKDATEKSYIMSNYANLTNVQTLAEYQG